MIKKVFFLSTLNSGESIVPFEKIFFSGRIVSSFFLLLRDFQDILNSSRFQILNLLPQSVLFRSVHLQYGRPHLSVFRTYFEMNSTKDICKIVQPEYHHRTLCDILQITWVRPFLEVYLPYEHSWPSVGWFVVGWTVSISKMGWELHFNAVLGAFVPA